MSRRLLIAVTALGLLLPVACGGADDGDVTARPAEVTTPAVAVRLSGLDVQLDAPGEAPRSVLSQSLRAGATWDGGLEFDLGVDGVLSARAIGDMTLAVNSVDEDGNAEARYTLDGLDVALGSGTGDPGQTTPDALSISGDVVVAPSRAGTQSATARVEASGSVPGAEGLAASLDPRLIFLLLPFPTQPVGNGATWTVTGTIPVFGTPVLLDAQVRQVERQGDGYTLGVTIAMEPADEDGPDLRLSGLGQVTGDLNQLGLETATIALSGTAVLPDRGPQRRPMTLRLEVEERHSDDAGADGSS